MMNTTQKLCGFQNHFDNVFITMIFGTFFSAMESGTIKLVMAPEIRMIRYIQMIFDL